MVRPRIPQATQDRILAECRRRCALCYALANDIAAKVHGQIAHIDRNPNNNGPENLAYLCLEHANLYDVAARQSKGFTPGELEKYKANLLLVLQFLHDPQHIRRIVEDEYRRLAAQAAAKELARKKKRGRRRRGDK